MNGTVSAQIGVAARAIIADARRLGLTWTMRLGTVASEINSSGVRVILDGDGNAIDTVPLVPWIPAGSRCAVIIVPPAGAYLVSGVAADDPRMGGRLAFVERTTSSTAASGAQGVLRLDNVPMFRGRRYEIGGIGIVLPTVAGAIGSLRLNYEIGTAQATTSSDILAISNVYLATVADGATIHVLRSYEPAYDLDMSILLYTIRAAGTGNVSTFASVGAGIDVRTQMWVDDVGPARNAAGVIGTVL